jgi:hypothetical protein
VCPRLLSLADAAAYLGLSPWSVRFHCPKLPILRFGRSVRYDVADLDALIATRKAKPWKEPA